jgi:hypothetical protein
VTSLQLHRKITARSKAIDKGTTKRQFISARAQKSLPAKGSVSLRGGKENDRINKQHPIGLVLSANSPSVTN